MGLPLSAIGLGFDALGSIGKAGLGIYQLIRGRKMNPQRPTYQIPDEVKRALGLAQLNLNARAAGASQAQRNIFASQANTLGAYRRGATSSAQLLNLVGAAQGQTNRALASLQANEAVDYQRRLSALNNAQRLMASFKDKEFQINKYEPYMQEAATKSALTQAGITNLFGGIGSAGRAAGIAGLMGVFSPSNSSPASPSDVSATGGVDSNMMMRRLVALQSLFPPTARSDNSYGINYNQKFQNDFPSVPSNMAPDLSWLNSLYKYVSF